MFDQEWELCCNFFIYCILKKAASSKKRCSREKMKQNDNDDYVVYQYCELLNNDKWEKFIEDPLNEKAKRDFLDHIMRPLPQTGVSSMLTWWVSLSRESPD